MTELHPPVDTLTQARVERAQRAECDNPIFPVLQRYRDMMRDFKPDSTEHRDALVGDLVAAAPFELDIDTIIATWAYGVADTDTPAIARDFSQALFATYVLYDPENPESVQVLVDYLETHELDGAGVLAAGLLEYARARFESLRLELDKLSIYVNGSKDAVQEAFQLSKSTDPEDVQRLDALLAMTEERNTPLLGAVRENTANATIVLGMTLQSVD